MARCPASISTGSAISVFGGSSATTSCLVRRSMNGRTVRAVAVRDIRERLAAEAEIRQLAHFDALTGLCNRRLLLEQVAQELTKMEHHPRRTAGEVVSPGRALEGGEPGQRVLARQTHRLARVGDDEIEVLAGDGLGQLIEPQRMQHEAMAGHALRQPAQQRLPLGSGQGRAAGRQHADAYRFGQGLHRLGLG